MVDHLLHQARGDLMRRIKSHGTKPEKIVSRLIPRIVGHFWPNARSLPGRPDIAIFRKRKAIFVHGCFWHQHRGCSRSNVPKTNKGYWIPKLARNVQRDRENIRALRRLGWKVLVIWECKCRNQHSLEQNLKRFIDTGKHSPRKQH